MGRIHLSKRICTVCKTQKDENEFHRKSKFKYTGRCFVCNNNRTFHNYYYSETAKLKRELRIAKRLEIINKAKSQPCMDCGQKFPEECMDFDHRENKLYTIANMKGNKIEKLIEEIAKCDIVCANCHRTRTKNRGYIENKKRFAVVA